MCNNSLTVLKFGGSVLTNERDLASAAHEIYRWVRQGQRVIAVVSALGRTTDRLLAQGFAYGNDPSPGALAALVATGEMTSAALLALALDRAGMPAQVLDAARIALRTEGPVLDSSLVSLNALTVRAVLRQYPVAIVPGFVGVNASGNTTLLGRGGSDLTALFIAWQLGAGRCRLVKDVPGLFDRDPARPGPRAKRYARLTWDDALQLDGRIVQHKAVRFARERRLPFEVGALNAADATAVGDQPAAFAPSTTTGQPPLRVSLLGLGNVGLGVYRAMEARPDEFEIVKVAVRNRQRGLHERVPPYLLTTDIHAAALQHCDVVVELIGGVEPTHELVRSALRRGVSVVTANKSLMARHGVELAGLVDSIASTAPTHGNSSSGRRGSGGRRPVPKLLYSATVGGAMPAIEAVCAATARGRIESISGVLNGTCNFVLDRLAEEHGFDGALAQAREHGFAEADATLDLEGHDARDKLRILSRVAFARDITESETTLTAITPALASECVASVQAGQRIRQVACVRRHGAGLAASVAPVALDADHELAPVRNEHNGLVIVMSDGARSVVRGRGAGRWPTTQAVMADLLDLARDRDVPVDSARSECHKAAQIDHHDGQAGPAQDAAATLLHAQGVCA